MKKNKIIFLILLLVVGCLFLFAACTAQGDNGGASNISASGGETISASQNAGDPQSGGQAEIALKKPKNVEFSDYYITWDKVSSAAGYVAVVDGKTYETDTNKLDLLNELNEGAYTAFLKAKGDGSTYNDSEAVEISFKIVATKNLNYNLLPGGDGYEVSKGTADLNGRIFIPDIYNNKPVLKIADNAFDAVVAGRVPDYKTGANCNIKTKGFRLPQDLKIIGENAFCLCAGFESVVIPDGVERIENQAFFKCARLNEIHLPDSVRYLGSFAFSGCEKLSAFNLPLNVTEIPEGCFNECSIGVFDIPDRVTSIGTSAFRCCEIKKLVIPETLKKIGDEAFAHTDVSTLTFPTHPQFDQLYGSAFYDTPWFYAQPDGFVVVGDILLIYKGALPAGDAIGDEDVPDGIKYVAGGLITQRSAGDEFDVNTGLKSIYFRDGLKFLGGVILYGNVSVRLPSDLKEIPAGFWFKNMGNETVVIPDGIEKVGTQNNCLRVIVPTSVNYFAMVAEYIFYLGTEDRLESVNAIYKKRVYCYSEQQPQKTSGGNAYVGIGRYWHYDRHGEPVVWTL